MWQNRMRPSYLRGPGGLFPKSKDDANYAVPFSLFRKVEGHKMRVLSHDSQGNSLIISDH